MLVISHEDVHGLVEDSVNIKLTFHCPVCYNTTFYKSCARAAVATHKMG